MKSRNLRSKISRAILFTSAVIAFLFGAILYPFEVDRYRAQINGARLLVDSVLNQRMEDLANELYADQRRALQASLAEICSVEGIEAASVYLPDGRHYASTDKRAIAAMDGRTFEAAETMLPLTTLSYDGRVVAVFSKPIEVIGTKIGEARIFYDLSALRKGIVLSAAFFITLLFSVILVLFLLLNVLLSHLVIKPVSALHNAIRKIDEGRLGETVQISSDDEIGRAARAFNTMSTKLARSQSALKEAEAMYRSIFENAREGIFRCTAGEGRFLAVNPAMARILGYESAEELLAGVESIRGNLHADPMDHARFEEILRRDGQVVDFETRLVRKDQSPVWVSISARRCRDASGDLSYDEGSLIDMTERREKEQAKRESEAAQAANKAKSEFLASMSHEIRTPMNAILGFTDLLGPLLTDPLHKSYVEAIRVSGKGLMTLINDILDLSKIEAGKMELKLAPVNLGLLVLEVYRIFENQAALKGIRFVTQVSPELPDSLLLDEARLRQVLINLIGNAVKSTECGEVRLEINLLERSQGADRVDLLLAVQDTGGGIDPDARQSIFESFSQAPCPARPDAHGGTGLGLAVSKRLTEMMGGTISVESTPGQGSKFEIILRDVSVGQSLESLPTSPRSSGSSENDPGWTGSKLLVADDLRLNRRLIIEMLRGMDITVIEAENGKAAVELARSQLPDLILMDITMPVMDGYAAIRELRKDPQTREIPVVAITSMAMGEDSGRLQSAGFDGLLFRPLERSQFVAELRRFAGRDPAPDRDDAPPDPQRRACFTMRTLAENEYTLLLDTLQNGLMADWRSVKQRRNISDIESFASRIVDLGTRYAVDGLKNFGDELLFHARQFDIDNILAALENYPIMVSEFERLGKPRG